MPITPIKMMLKIEQISRISLEVTSTSPYGGEVKIKGVLTLDANKYEQGDGYLKSLEIVRPDGSIVANTPNLVANIDEYYVDGTINTSTGEITI